MIAAYSGDPRTHLTILVGLGPGDLAQLAAGAPVGIDHEGRKAMPSLTVMIGDEAVLGRELQAARLRPIRPRPAR